MSGKSSKIRYLNSYINRSDNENIEKMLIKRIENASTNSVTQTNSYIDTSLNTVKNQIDNSLNNIVCESISYKYNIGTNTMLPYNSIPYGNNDDRYKCLNYVGGMLEVNSVEFIDPSSGLNGRLITTNCFDYLSAIGNDGFELLNDAVLLINIEVRLNNSISTAVGFQLQGHNGEFENGKKKWINIGNYVIKGSTSLVAGSIATNNLRIGKANMNTLYKFTKDSNYNIYI